MKHGLPAEEEKYAVWRVWESKYEATPLLGKKREVEHLALQFWGLGAWAPLLPILLGLTH